MNSLFWQRQIKTVNSYLAVFFIPFMNYSEKLRHPDWQMKRLEIFKRENKTCQCCGDTQTCLNVHHLEYAESGLPQDTPNDKLILLCEDCHHVLELEKIKWVPTIKGIKRKLSIKTLLLLTEEGLWIHQFDIKNNPKYVIGFAHTSLSKIVQTTINYWLAKDQNNYLVEKSFKKIEGQ